MSIVSNIIYAITDTHCCFSSNIISCCATCFAKIEMFLIQFYNSTFSLRYSGGEYTLLLQRNCYIPKHLGKHFSKPTKLKMQFFYGLALTRTENKVSFYSKGCTACKQGCGVGGKISDFNSDLSKISDS